MAWQQLCSDALQVVLHNRSLRELAYMPFVSWDFHQQYVTKAKSERARLLTDTEATFGGSDFLSKFVEGLVPPLCGVGRWPTDGPINLDGDVKVTRTPINTPAGAAIRWSRLFVDLRTGMNRRSYSGKGVFFTSITKTIKHNGQSQEEDVTLAVLKYRRNDVILRLMVGRTALRYALGVLLAICREIGAAVQEARPLTVELDMQRSGDAALGFWEAKDLIAPLRALADDIIFYPRGRAHEAPVMPLETGQGRPLRQLIVEIA